MNNLIDNLRATLLDWLSDIMKKINGVERAEKIVVRYDIFSYTWCVTVFFIPKVALVSSTVNILGCLLKYYLINNINLKSGKSGTFAMNCASKKDVNSLTKNKIPIKLPQCYCRLISFVWDRYHIELTIEPKLK